MSKAVFFLEIIIFFVLCTFRHVLGYPNIKTIVNNNYVTKKFSFCSYSIPVQICHTIKLPQSIANHHNICLNKTPQITA